MDYYDYEDDYYEDDTLYLDEYYDANPYSDDEFDLTLSEEYWNGYSDDDYYEDEDYRDDDYDDYDDYDY